jgi:hypothetical protein
MAALSALRRYACVSTPTSFAVSQACRRGGDLRAAMRAGAVVIFPADDSLQQR